MCDDYGVFLGVVADDTMQEKKTRNRQRIGSFNLLERKQDREEEYQMMGADHGTRTHGRDPAYLHSHSK